MTALAPLLQAFFTDRLIAQHRASEHTIAGYRDTFRLRVLFASAGTAKQPSALDASEVQATDVDGRGRDAPRSDVHPTAIVVGNA